MSITREPQHSSVAAPPPEPALGPPSPRLSPIRVLVLLLVLAGAAFVVWRLVNKDTGAGAVKVAPVYAPYVDVTLTPTYPFQLPSANPVSSVYLAFVVSAKSQPCTPTWGTFYTLAAAEQSLNLDARTAEVRTQGGAVNVSFGGQANSEMAVGCTNPTQLVNAYLAPIQRYHATTIDFDIEGATLADTAADARRAAAVATIQRQLAAKHTPLRVWVTLPVSNAGLTAQGTAAVRAMLSAHVKLAGVNAMAMDFGPGEGAAQNMIGTVESSLTATRNQVQSLWRASGTSLGAAAAWGHVGATVMIGDNDVAGQRFTTTDARNLSKFVKSHGIPRVSAWSLNRDSQCGGAFAQTGVVSNTCSGVVQTPLAVHRHLQPSAGHQDRQPDGHRRELADATADRRQPGDQPVSDLERDRAVRDRLQDRLAGPDLPGELVQPGHGARVGGRGRADRSLAGARPGAARQPRAGDRAARRPAPTRSGRRPRSTTPASASASAVCRTKRATTPTASSPSAPSPPTRAPPGRRCTSTPASRRPAPVTGAS